MPPAERYVLRLFVAGMSERSREAVLRVRHLCETRLAGRHELHVVDVLQQPELVKDSQVVATPALVRESPRPVRRFFGDLHDTAAICAGLGLPVAEASAAAEEGREPAEARLDGPSTVHARPEGPGGEGSTSTP